MPKVTGPLFSLSASGSVGRFLTFKTTARGHIVTRPPIPTGPPSIWQTNQRQRLTDAAAAWAALDDNTRAIWGSNSRPTIRSGWMSFFMEWQAQQVQAGALPLIPSQYIGIETHPDWSNVAIWDDGAALWGPGVIWDAA